MSQLFYWTPRADDPDGWVHKTISAWKQETGLSRSEQTTARLKLRKVGALKEERRGTPYKTFFQIDIQKLSQLLKLSESSNQALLRARIKLSYMQRLHASRGRKSGDYHKRRFLSDQDIIQGTHGKAMPQDHSPF